MSNLKSQLPKYCQLKILALEQFFFSGEISFAYTTTEISKDEHGSPNQA